MSAYFQTTQEENCVELSLEAFVSAFKLGNRWQI